jgi:hypothetical protein
MSSEPIQAVPDPIDHAICGLYKPGHQVHFIQAKLSWQGDPAKYRSGTLASVDDDGWITIDVDGETVRVWNHDPVRARRLIEASGGQVALRDPHILATRSATGNYLFSIADTATACMPPSATSDNSPAGLVEQVRSRGGFMVSGAEILRTLKKGDAVEEEGAA